MFLVLNKIKEVIGIPKKIECKLTKDELEYLYCEQNLTQKQLASILGIKSDITMRKILHSYNIDTNKNRKLAELTKKGMSDLEFKNYLKGLYLDKHFSINQISKKLNVSSATITKYFKKYNIQLFTQKESAKLFYSLEKNKKWNGGKIISSHGYVQIHKPNHPYCDDRGYVYEHRLVIEKQICRYLSTNEVIHHIDGNKLNNSLENLRLMTNEEHSKFHNNLRRKKVV